MKSSGRKTRHYRIYAVINSSWQVAFVGKSYAKSLASLYSQHANGRNYLTAYFYGKCADKLKPELLVLEKFTGTGAEAYKHVIAWTRYLKDHGYLLLVHTGTEKYADDLYPDTAKIYDSIKDVPLKEVLSRTDRSWDREDPPVRKHHKEARPKLSLRLDPEDKKAFLELKRSLNITQREAFHLLLDNMVIDGDSGRKSLIRQQENRIATLKEEMKELTNRLMEEHAAQKQDQRNKELLNHAKNVVTGYLYMTLKDIFYAEEPLRPVRKPQNNIMDFAYPKSKGPINIQLDELIYGKSSGVVFVLGWTENEEPIKLRHYGKRDFLGIDPKSSRYAVRGSRWQVHYQLNQERVADLMAALPLPPQPEKDQKNTSGTELDSVIREINNRKG